MNDGQIEEYVEIKEYVDEIFRDVAPSARVTEQKEELAVNISERVQDYMRGGLCFDAAFENAKMTMGDISELTAPFEKTPRGFGSQTPPMSPPPAYSPSGHGEAPGGSRLSISLGNYGLTAISPFAYVIIGLIWNWIEGYAPIGLLIPNWWAWGWVLIPGSAILCTQMDWTKKFAALSPFIFLLLGFWFDMWAFGWVIIPIAGLVAGGVIKVTKE